MVVRAYKFEFMLHIALEGGGMSLDLVAIFNQSTTAVEEEAHKVEN
jgi:hypothetical protein